MLLTASSHTKVKYLLFYLIFGSSSLDLVAQSSFVASTDITLSGNPVSITNADFDNNGISDFAIGKQNSNGISIFLADGKGGYEAPVEFEIPNEITSIVAADVSNDRNTDLIYTSASANEVYLLLGDGNGNFSISEPIQVGDSPREITVANLNSDEYLDIVTVNNVSDNITVLLADTNLMYTRTDFSVGDGPKSVVALDFNQDSMIDLAIANSISDDITVLTGNGAGHFSTMATFSTGDNPQKIVGGDFNEDGFSDIITANQLSNQINLLLGDGNNDLLGNVFVDTPINPVDLTVGHFNGDNYLDAITLNAGSNNITLFAGDGLGSLNAARSFSVSENAIDLDAVDLNSDNITDLILADFSADQIRLMYGGASGQFGPQINGITPSAYFPQGIVSGDFNSDSFVDIAISHDPIINRSIDQVSIFLNDGYGKFGGRHLFKNVGENPQDMEVIDFNNDGVLDLISAVVSDDLIAILIGDGTGDFEISTIANSGSSRELAVGYLNEDEFVDIVGTYNSSGIVVFLGNGVDGELSRLIINTGGYSNDVAIADVNGDGLNDIVASNCCYSNNSKVSVILNEGGGNFQTPYTILEETDPRRVKVGDINGDSHADLVVMGNSNNVSVLLGDGTGAFTLVSTIPVKYIRGLELVDITGNNNLDLLVTDISKVHIYEGNGEGEFEKMQSYNSGGQTQFVTAADYTNDQKIDFAVSNATTDDFYVYLNNTSEDQLPPEVLISSNIESLDTIQNIEITVTFSEQIKGFSVSDFTIDNGSITGDLIMQNDQSFTVNVIPIAGGNLSLSIAENKLSDLHGNGNLSSDLLTIPIILNQPPTDIQLNDNTIEENQPADVLVGMLSTVDSDEEDIHTYSLVGGSGDSDNDLFTISGDLLSSRASFDFETQSTFSVRIQTNDGNEGAFEKSFSIEITDANDSPTDLLLSNQMISENQIGGTVVGSLSGVDPDSSDHFTYTLVTGSGDADNSQFMISDDQLLSVGSFDFETQSSFSVRISTNDGNGGTIEKSFTIEITDVNDAPSNILLDNNLIEENQPISHPVGILSTVDDEIVDSHTYALVSGSGDSDNNQFTITNDRLASANTFDFEMQSTYSVRVQTNDGKGGIFEKPLIILVADRNDSISDIQLSNHIIEENETAGAFVGLLNSIDEDKRDMYTYSLITGYGDEDNHQFTITNNRLLTTNSFDFESQSTFTIRVNSDDGNGDTFEKVLAIQVSDANDTPTDILLSNNTIEENLSAGTVMGLLTSVDEDGEDNHNYALVAGAGDADNALFTIEDDQLVSSTSFDFESQATFSIRIRTEDENGGSLEKTLIIEVINANDTPTDILLSNNTIEENQLAGTVVGFLSSVDEDGEDNHNYTLVAGAGDADNALFTIEGDQLISSTSFDFESQATFSIRIRTEDENGGSLEKTLIIEVINANDTPTDILLSNNTIEENQLAGTVVGFLSSVDEDGEDNHNYTLVAGAGDADNALFTIEGDQLISSTSFDFESQSSLSIRVQTDDGDGGTLENFFKIQVLDMEEIITSINTPDKISIYPNPSERTFQIKWAFNELITVTIYESDGKFLTRKRGTESEINDWLFSKHFGQGVLYVSFSSENLKFTRKVVMH